MKEGLDCDARVLRMRYSSQDWVSLAWQPCHITLAIAHLSLHLSSHLSLHTWHLHVPEHAGREWRRSEPCLPFGQSSTLHSLNTSDTDNAVLKREPWPCNDHVHSRRTRGLLRRYRRAKIR